MSLTTQASIEAIWNERQDWQRLLEQEAEEQLDVYIDLKSPHAYLAVRPALEIARDYRVAINFLPYTLSYTTLGISERVGPEMRREPATPAADRKARMYYAAAREYAALQSLPFKSPKRLLDSNLAHRVMLFAKAQGLTVPFTMWVYLQGWSSGWQGFELESIEDLKNACRNAGVDTNGLENFVQPGGPGEQQLAKVINTAETQGIAGTPHFVFNDLSKERMVGLFGREHLALIRSKFAAAGLARRAGVVAEFSHAWSGPSSGLGDR